MRYEGEPVFYKEGKVYWRGEVMNYHDWKIDKNLDSHEIKIRHTEHISFQIIYRSLCIELKKRHKPLSF